MRKENAWAGGLLKTAAFLLAVVALLTFLLSAATVITCTVFGAYTQDNGKLVQEYVKDMADSLACDIASFHAQELYAPEENFYYNDAWNFYFNGEYTNYRFAIYEQGQYDGILLKTNYNGEVARYTFFTEVSPCYMTTLKTADSYEEGYHEVDAVWIVKAYILENTGFSDRFSVAYGGLTAMFRLKTTAIWLMVAGLLAAILNMVYLFCAAGRRPGSREIQLNLLDKIPMEIYLAAPVGLGAGLFLSLDELLRYWEHSLTGYEGALLVAAVCGTAVLLVSVVLGLSLSIATRLKRGRGYIWRQTLVFLVIKAGLWCLRRLLRLTRTAVRHMGRLFRLLPLLWQWLAISLGLGFVLFLAAVGHSVFLLLLGLLLWGGLTVYYAVSFATLQKTLRHMADGDPDSRVELRGLYGNFRLAAKDINAISAGTELEIDRRMRSERMKTELITNVSHDIKTPLTSIVTYVDLLQKNPAPREQAQYLEVLARQAQRLKKLTEDLIEMSKASSGNLPVELGKTGIVELINQALAEYEDKMESAGLKIVKKLPETELYAKADGRLFWRVMDNILSNCVKYALPGTRVYVDVSADSKGVAVRVKNISREPLEHTPEELMERFVRDDRSRNTEGSGLGLNISASLMELQGGNLEIGLDGDLFKVLLTLQESE